jgi:RNAse (barnase) inhibitor barstar
MVNKTLVIDGERFITLDEFYTEVIDKLTVDCDWCGRNLDAFNDILRGGFGVFEYDEPITLIWKHSHKSKKDLGFQETIKYLEDKLNGCHPTNTESIQKDLAAAKAEKGQPLFERIINIILSHPHITLKLE